MKFDLSAPWVPLIRRLPKGEGSVALSFDDGPTPETTPVLLELLKTYRAKATFFVLGSRAQSHPELIEALVEGGHSVFAHGWDHIRLDRVSSERMISDLEKTEALLRRYRKTPSPYIVRLPYAGGYRNPSVHRALRRWNASIQIAHWSHHFGDPELAAQSQDHEDLQRRATDPLAAVLDHPSLEGGIVLLHEMAADITGPMLRDVPIYLARSFLEGLVHRDIKCRAIQAWESAPYLSRFFLR